MNKTSLSLVLLLSGSLAACGVLKGGEDTQVTVDKAVLGMAAGDFFSLYGPARTRVEQPDQSMRYLWVSRIGATAAGPMGQDDRVCRLTVIVNGRGRIASATITQDNPGRVSTSRCIEVFTGKQSAPDVRLQPGS